MRKSIAGSNCVLIMYIKLPAHAVNTVDILIDYILISLRYYLLSERRESEKVQLESVYCTKWLHKILVRIKIYASTSRLVKL